MGGILQSRREMMQNVHSLSLRSICYSINCPSSSSKTAPKVAAMASCLLTPLAKGRPSPAEPVLHPSLARSQSRWRRPGKRKLSDTAITMGAMELGPKGHQNGAMEQGQKGAAVAAVRGAPQRAYYYSKDEKPHLLRSVAVLRRLLEPQSHSTTMGNPGTVGRQMSLAMHCEMQ
jgi:hypothetical protein